MTCQREAPRARNTSRSSGSTVAMPVATLTNMGKNESRNAVMTAGFVTVAGHGRATRGIGIDRASLCPTVAAWREAATRGPRIECLAPPQKRGAGAFFPVGGWGPGGMGRAQNRLLRGL